MMMQNVFSFKRFRLLVYKHWNEFRTTLWISIFLMILAALFGKITLPYQDQDLSYTIFINFLILFGGIFTAMFFKDWSYKARSVSLAILPASAFEKIMVVLFYTIVVFIPLFTLIYFVSLFGLLKISNHDRLFIFFDQYRGLSPLAALLLYAIIPYIFFQSLALLCSVWIKKMQILIAFGVFAILLVGSIFLNSIYIESLLNLKAVSGSTKQLVFFPLDINYWDHNSAIPIQTMTRIELITRISAIVLMISTILFYLASYFKLKEKEI